MWSCSRTRAFGAVVLALALGACPAREVVRGDRALRPGWIPRPNRAHPDVLYVTGVCRDRSTLADGRACALADAEAQVRGELRDPNARVEGRYVQDEYHERRGSALSEVRDVWVLVAYPRKVLQALKVKQAARVAFGFACHSDTKGGCDEGLVTKIEQAAAMRGFTLTPTRLVSEAVAQPARAIEQAHRQYAAQVLLVTAHGRFLGREDREHYAESRCSYRVLDATDGKVLSTIDIGPVKDGHVTRRAAVGRAVSRCIDQLALKLAGR